MIHKDDPGFSTAVDSKPQRKTKRKLDSSDIATILAALRMFQKYYRDNAADMRADWPEHFLDGAGRILETPSLKYIDQLCEEINFGEVRL